MKVQRCVYHEYQHVLEHSQSSHTQSYIGLGDENNCGFFFNSFIPTDFLIQLKMRIVENLLWKIWVKKYVHIQRKIKRRTQVPYLTEGGDLQVGWKKQRCQEWETLEEYFLKISKLYCGFFSSLLQNTKCKSFFFKIFRKVYIAHYLSGILWKVKNMVHFTTVVIQCSQIQGV